MSRNRSPASVAYVRDSTNAENAKPNPIFHLALSLKKVISPTQVMNDSSNENAESIPSKIRVVPSEYHQATCSKQEASCLHLNKALKSKEWNISNE